MPHSTFAQGSAAAGGPAGRLGADEHQPRGRALSASGRPITPSTWRGRTSGWPTWTWRPGPRQRQERRAAARHELLRRGLDRHHRDPAAGGLSRDRARPDRLRPVVEADPALFDQHACGRTPSGCSITCGSRPPTSSRTRWAAWWRAASPRLSGDGRQPGDDQPDRAHRRAGARPGATTSRGLQGGAGARLRRDRARACAPTTSTGSRST